MELLTTNNHKLLKSLEKGYLTVGLHLAPFTLSGFNTCPMASKGCSAACLNTAGCGAFSTVQQARINKTKLLFEDREFFLNLLNRELELWSLKARKRNLILCCRLNVTSDIPWELPNFGEIPSKHENVFFYDYTKIRKRLYDTPYNYHLTFSRSEDSTDEELRSILRGGFNVAVVFSSKSLPDHYLDNAVISGDEDDLRFLDESPRIVGLSAKGKAKKDTTGFVIQI
jgi:hypothetical protein